VSGHVLTRTAEIRCAHGGEAQPVGSNARVLVSGQPVMVLADTYAVTGCPLPPDQGTGPCRSGQFTTGTSRVWVLGQPVLTQDSTSICSPTGTPLQIVMTQQRVTAR
jgi:hypothetical protein